MDEGRAKTFEREGSRRAEGREAGRVRRDVGGRVAVARPRIGIVVGTTKEGRFGEKPARWMAEMVSARADLDCEIVDLRDYPLPLFDEAAGPAVAPPEDETALRFGEKMAELDGYAFVTAEYNHGIPGVLKNALDQV